MTTLGVCEKRCLRQAAATFALLAGCLLVPKALFALDNGLALKPPMGWLAWERFTCQTDCETYPDSCINSKLFKRTADRLVEDGFYAAGYQFVNIDDCWSELERAQNGRLLADKSRFPLGIDELANYVHQSGLKLGIYGDCGTKTCAGYPAQLKPKRIAQEATDKQSVPALISKGADFEAAEEEDYFQLDAQTFADWRIDSFKFDGCFIDPLRSEQICPAMAAALNATQRPILLSCEWPFYMMYAHAQPNFSLAAQSCNLWRYYDDIEDSWQSVLNTIDYTVKHQSTIIKHHGPSHWFDPDQLVVGNFGLSGEQERAQMAIWALWSAPLYMSTDLRSLTESSRLVLLNKRLIALDQDPLGLLGLRVAVQGQVWAFVKAIEPVSALTGCPSFAVVYLNRATSGNRIKASFALRDLLRAAPLFEAGQRSSAVRAANCARLLERAMKSNSSQPAKAQTAGWLSAPSLDTQQLTFSIEDLFNDPLEADSLAIKEQLALRVAPSGVRAIKLMETRSSEQQESSQ